MVVRAGTVDMLDHRTIATQFRITRTLVHRLLKAHRKDEGFLDALQTSEEQQQLKLAKVVAAIQTMREQKLPIWRTSLVQDAVLRDHGLRVRRPYVAHVLRHALKMRYRRVKPIPFDGNSDRCLILRMKCAQAVLAQLSAGKRLLNIDETWLSRTDFRRCRWRARGDTNSVPIKQLGKRLSVLMAIDTEGNSYSALSQANTDHETFGLFLWKLSAKLTEEDCRWREDTIFVMDG